MTNDAGDVCAIGIFAVKDNVFVVTQTAEPGWDLVSGMAGPRMVTEDFEPLNQAVDSAWRCARRDRREAWEFTRAWQNARGQLV